MTRSAQPLTAMLLAALFTLGTWTATLAGPAPVDASAARPAQLA